MIYPINHLPDKIPIGIQTEQGVEVIGFDLKPWLDALPDMHFTVCHTRPGETDAYPVNDHMMVGMVLYWHPDGYDTAIAGEGKVEIVGVGENRRKLSGFVQTAIPATSLGTTKEPGESVAPWYEAVLQAAQDVKADVDVGTGGLYLVNTKKGKADRTQDEIRAAVAAGKTCLLTDDLGMVYTYYEEMDYPSDPSETQCPTFTRYEKAPDGIAQYEARVLSTSDVIVGWFNGLCHTPNPWHLVFDGLGVTYNGSKQVRVQIPTVPEDASKLFITTATYDAAQGKTIADHTSEEIFAAVTAGKSCFLSAGTKTMCYVGKKNGEAAFASVHWPTSGTSMQEFGLWEESATVDADGVLTSYTMIPATTPNPWPLTIKLGNESTAYTGNNRVTVEVLPVPADAASAAYLRWNGSAWVAATIDQLKADLGLT